MAMCFVAAWSSGFEAEAIAPLLSAYIGMGFFEKSLNADFNKKCAVDSVTESEIQVVLDRLSAGITTFVIAHRISTIVGVGRILFLREGQVVESGSHQEPVTKSEGYQTFERISLAAIRSRKRHREGQSRSYNHPFYSKSKVWLCSKRACAQ